MQLVLVDSNPVDEAWGDERPGQPDAPVRVHPAKFAGYNAAHKLSDVRTAMAEVGATATVITALDEVAWLLNIRGGDISHNPITIAYVIVRVPWLAACCGERAGVLHAAAMWRHLLLPPPPCHPR